MTDCEFNEKASGIIRMAIDGVRVSVEVWVSDKQARLKIQALLDEVYTIAHLAIKRHNCSVTK